MGRFAQDEHLHHQIDKCLSINVDFSIDASLIIVEHIE
jgi:hypothetical protein